MFDCQSENADVVMQNVVDVGWPKRAALLKLVQKQTLND